jgi:hypothetical protein
MISVMQGFRNHHFRFWIGRDKCRIFIMHLWFGNAVHKDAFWKHLVRWKNMKLTIFSALSKQLFSADTTMYRIFFLPIEHEKPPSKVTYCRNFHTAKTARSYLLAKNLHRFFTVLNTSYKSLKKNMIDSLLQKIIILIWEIVHCELLEYWSTQKSVWRIWQHFSCLLDEGIPKVWKKLNSHGGFLRAD